MRLHRARAFTAAVFLLAFALFGIVNLTCDTSTDQGGCPDVSPDLWRTMYWGYVSAVHWEANRGVEIGHITRPVWFAPDTILVRTGRLDHGNDVYGIFSVLVDPATFSFRGFRTHAFPYPITDYDYNPATRRFVFTFSKAQDNTQAVYGRAVDGALAIQDTLLGAAWYPIAVRYVQNDDVVAYAHNPSTSVNGFYFVSADGSTPDSLIQAVDLSVSDAQGFDVAKHTLIYGQTQDYRAGIVVLDLTGRHPPQRIFSADGEFVSASLNAAGTCALISVFIYGTGVGSTVWAVNLSSHDKTRVSVKTHSCFPIADFPCWNPSQTAFAFSASGYSGEGDLWPYELWIKTKVTCPH